MDGEKSNNRHDGETGSATNQRSDEKLEQYLERKALQQRMCHIQHKILILSGKGGVGKSTIAVNLAVSLSLAGKKVGLLDIDIHGPSIPRLLNMEGAKINAIGNTFIPAYFENHIKVMSIGFLLGEGDQAVIWRGPMKMKIIKQFLKDVEWGELDYLIIDSPPGTGDEPLSICQLIEDADGAIIVTTPQELSLIDVRRSITFCRKLNLPVLGVIENMSGFVCPHCSNVVDIFKKGGGEVMAHEMSVPFLGSIPIDSDIVEACDAGQPYISHYSSSETAKSFARITRPIIELDTLKQKDQKEKIEEKMEKKDGEYTRIAIPLAEGKLAQHFGHCEKFVLFDVDEEKKEIVNTTTVSPPAHQPGILPPWLAERGVDMIITGGMGSRAKSLFDAHRIKVVTGAASDEPTTIVNQYLEGTLVTGENICDH